MDSLIDDMQRVDFPLIVSLPRNDPQLARAVIDEGASALKVHLNCHHRASGTKFGSFAQERHKLEEISSIARDAKCHMGIMPGAERCATREELEILGGLGFEFFDIYAGDLPAQLLTMSKLRRVLAFGPDYDLEEIRTLKDLGVDALEASIIPPEGYGLPLTARDLCRYRSLVTASKLPVIVPTQRKITLDDLSLLREAGISSLMIGAVVTGVELETLRRSVRAFRIALSE
ncbi:MAG: hypothetical protein HY814_08635 [Candidatus Riflebacteria bacterium]|nr:hypothetical protein [Candidatus Riflebacteria bacterium]